MTSAMIASAAAISSMARSMKAVITAHDGCGSSAKATGTTSGTSRWASPIAAARMRIDRQKIVHAARIVRSSHGCGRPRFNDTAQAVAD